MDLVGFEGRIKLEVNKMVLVSFYSSYVLRKLDEKVIRAKLKKFLFTYSMFKVLCLYRKRYGYSKFLGNEMKGGSDIV